MSKRPPTSVVLSVLVNGSLMALVGMTLGCDGGSPGQPTPTRVTPALVTSPTVTPTPVAALAVTLTAGTNRVGPGSQLSVSWTTSTGGGNDWIALFAKGDPN